MKKVDTFACMATALLAITGVLSADDNGNPASQSKSKNFRGSYYVDGDEQDVRPVDRVGGVGPLVRQKENDEECNRREACKSRGSSHHWFELHWN